MPFDPTIVLRGINPTHDYNHLAGERMDLATAGQDLKTRQLRYQADQIKLRQLQQEEAQDKIINDAYGAYYKGIKDRADRGAARTADPSLTPSLKGGGNAATEGNAITEELPPQVTSIAAATMQPPDAVQSGSELLPGPGGIGWGSGEPIQQISPDASVADRPSLGQMMGPVSVASSADQAQPQADTSVAEAAAAVPSRSDPAGALPQTPGPADGSALPTAPANPYTNPMDFVPAVRDALVAAGHGHRALQFEAAANKYIETQRDLVAKRQLAEVNAEKARYNQMANDLDNFIANTPDSRKGQEWGSFLSRQVRSGHLTPQEAADYQQYPGADRLPALHSQLIGHTQALADGLKQIEIKERQAKLDTENAEREAKIRKTKSDAAEAQLKAEEGQRASDANVLSAAARKGKDAYAAALAKLPEDRRAAFPDKHGPTTAEDVMLAGMNNTQRAAHLDRQATERSSELARQSLAAYRVATLGLRREGLNRESATERVNRSQAQAQANKLQGQENGLYRVVANMRAQLDLAAQGKPFYELNDKGEHSPTASPSSSADAAWTLMQKHNAAVEEVQRLITEKYNALAPYGVNPAESVESMNKKLEAGKYTYADGKVKPPQAPKPQTQQAAPPATQQAKPGPKKDEKRTHMGATYVFDGSVWVKQ